MAIAEAGIGLIATRGLRALTHRAVDTELAAPAGTTSYYARTRRDLIALIVHALADQTRGEVEAAPMPDVLTVATAAAGLSALIERFVQTRPLDHVARFALLAELRSDPQLHAILSHASPVRARLLASADGLLRLLGVEDAGAHAPDLVGLVDGILFDRLVGGGRVRAGPLVEAYLRGLPLEAKALDGKAASCPSSGRR